MNSEEKYMRRAIELAALGAGKVSPNPMVGAVVVHNDVIVGEGYHEKYGEAHAEVNAVNAVANPEILSECTIYVSLEPCAHHGKTPPCADLIVEKQLKRVVIGCGDSFAQVNGKGIERLTAAGIEVTAFLLEDQARALNRKFFTVQEKKRPHVTLKWAETRNGFIDNTSGKKGEISWISGPETQAFVHKLRAECDAILVGKNTVINDNPSLTVRAVSGKNPIRVVLDSNCELSTNYAVFNNTAETIVFNTVKNEELKGISYIQLESMEAENILNALHGRGIQSVLLEGGRNTIQSFRNHWDEAVQIVGQTVFESGTKAPVIEGTLIKQENIFGDLINFYRP